jgi:hypothetical protein
MRKKESNLPRRITILQLLTLRSQEKTCCAIRMLKINCPFRKPRKRCKNNIKMNLRLMSIVGLALVVLNLQFPLPKCPLS